MHICLVQYCLTSSLMTWMMWHSAPSASLLMILNWEKCLKHWMALLLFWVEKRVHKKITMLKKREMPSPALAED